MAALGAALCRLCRAYGDFRQDRSREREFRLCHLIRTIIILLTLGFILAVTGEWQPLGSVSGRSYLFLTLSGLATGGSWVCYFRALKFGDAARVAPIDKLSVVLVALFAFVFLGERLSGPNWLGIVFIAAGAVLVAYKG
jgi:bacterial/archaeal transporter family protein